MHACVFDYCMHAVYNKLFIVSPYFELVFLNKYILVICNCILLLITVLKMKLLTHNMLTSKCLKGVVTGYPLKLVVNEMKSVEVDFNPEFVKRILPKMDYGVLRDTATSLGVELPLEKDNSESSDFLNKVHHALLELEVISGDLICPETGRKFSIKDGIPNMLCNEEEV